MDVSIDIDIGGTFTDCFVIHGDDRLMVKTPTTGYNLSVGLMKAIEEAAASLKLSPEALLEETAILRYSTTVAMNKLIERKGPRLGLLFTQGFEDTIYIGKGSQWADGLPVKEQRNIARIQRPVPLIPRPLTVGVMERVDSQGTIVRPLNEDDLLEKIQYLVDQGVRGFVVALLWSHINPTHERRVGDIIAHEYPESYLGKMPVFLSHEVLPKRFEYTRTMTTILNAYLHQAIADELSSITDELRDRGYRKPLMMVHNSGGMAEVFRTSAIHTYNGGPVAGLMGGAHLGKLYGFKNVIVTDMGGTSFDLGLIVEGSLRFYQFNPVIDRWLVDHTIIDMRSIGAGGGSIARVNTLIANRLEVGPESAGSLPGPVCYDMGGAEPTVTDADVVLGYLNPNYFHGGRRRLNRNKAVRAIRDKIAKPLGLSVEEAAHLIKKVVDGNMGNEIYKETVLKGYDPREYILFAYGGAGPTHCCGYGDHLGIDRIICFTYSPVFCAFGSSTMDVLHIYEQSRRIPLLAPVTKALFEDYARFNEVVDELKARAWRDVAGEGFADAEIQFILELDMKYGGQLHIKRAASPHLYLEGPQDVQAVYDAFEHEYSQAYSPLGVYPEGGVEIENFILKAVIPRPKPPMPEHPAKTSDPRRALKEKRDIFSATYNCMREASIYEGERLEAGNIIEGLAVIEYLNTTLMIPESKKCSVDPYLNCVIENL